jgi:3-oxoacyl-[acyl-carrier-protein] synthase-3
VGLLIADRLESCAPDAEFRQACTGSADALQTAAGMLMTVDKPPDGIIGSKTGSVSFDPAAIERDQERLANFAMMGDAAGAAVLGPDDGQPGPRIETLFFGALGTGRKPGLSLHLDGSGEPFAADGDFGPTFRHDFAHIKESGLRLFQAGLETSPEADIDIDRIARVIPDQANGRMGEILTHSRTGYLPREVLRQRRLRGQHGLGAIWVALHALRTSGLLGEGDSVLIRGAEATQFMFGGFVYHHAA